MNTHSPEASTLRATIARIVSSYVDSPMLVAELWSALAPQAPAEGDEALAERLRDAYHSKTRIGHPMWKNLDADRKEPWLAVARATRLIDVQPKGAEPGWVIEAMQEALSVCDSVSMSRDRRVVREGCVLYMQTEEWCQWAEQEVAPKMRAALAAVSHAAEAATPPAPIPVEGPVNPGETHLRYRLRNPGESLEHYRIAMGWDKQTADPAPAPGPEAVPGEKWEADVECITDESGTDYSVSIRGPGLRNPDYSDVWMKKRPAEQLVKWLNKSVLARFNVQGAAVAHEGLHPRLDWAARTLRAVADRGRDGLGDSYPEVLQVLGALNVCRDATAPASQPPVQGSAK